MPTINPPTCAHHATPPLLAVADVAGGQWPARARAACRYFVFDGESNDKLSLGVRLLRDVRTVYKDRDRMFSADNVAPDQRPRGLERWTIDPAAGSVTRRTLDDAPQELPVIDDRRRGRPYRYAYALGLPVAWADAVFHDAPSWVSALLGLREALVGLVGIERGGRAAFDVVAVDDHEVLLGSDAGHLDFRASVRREPDRVVVSTVVQIHDLRGRLYFAAVQVVHPAVVRAMLTRAAATLAAPVP